MTELYDHEERDAVRLSWNVWPNKKLEATKCIIPFAALYTPMKKVANALEALPYEPVICKNCGAVLNPWSQVDYQAKIWTCPFCHTRNHFPSQYHGITPEQVPAELWGQYTTVEYTMQRSAPPQRPCYLFVVDTCVPEDELQACRKAIMHALEVMPEWCNVGLITFGTHVHVHELGFQELPKSYIFRGSKEYTPQQVIEQLGVGRGGQRPGQGQQHPAGGRFLLPLSECEFQINSILEELQRDAFPAVTDHRPSRCTGTAVQVAVALAGALLPPGSCIARCMLFVGGACTDGGGAVVGKELAEELRSHKDLAKDSALYWRKACKFYESIAAQLTNNGHALDVFSCSLDQVGLAEMKPAILQSGGMAVQTDTFLNPIFKQSLQRMFVPENEEGFLGLSSSATFEVVASKDVKVAGLLGPASKIERRNQQAVSDTPIGIGGTTAWKLCSLDLSTTLAVYFDISASSNQSHDPSSQANQQFFLQFITKYLHYSGQMRCRVTTITRRWIDGASPNALADLMSSFDQEAAAVLMARWATHKMETEEDFDATRWLDRTLIRLAQRFGEYRKDDPQSFALDSSMGYYPQFMFNLRRSQFVQVFGNSPDETGYFRLMLFREPCAEAMLMIQPTLMSFSFSGPPEPVLLDVQSIMPDRVLLLDSFFNVVICHGSTIAAWRKANYQDNPEYASFKELLEAPKVEVYDIQKRRFPVPRSVECDHGSSQARFLLVKLNPSSTYASAQQAMSGEVINTDDVSLAVFTEHLKKLAVQS